MGTPLRLATATGLLALAAVCGGCAGLGNGLKDPDIRLERVVLREVDLRGGRLDLQLEIDNPNPVDLRGVRLKLGFFVEGSHVGDVLYDEDFSIDRGGRTDLGLPLRFDWAGVGTTLRTALNRGEIPYMMKGELSLQTPWGAQGVPFTRDGQVPLSRVGEALPAQTGR